MTGRRGAASQARQVRGEQPEARRVPAWVGSSRLGEHCPENHDVARGYVPGYGPVSPSAVDDPLDDPVDLLADGLSSSPRRGRSAVQRQHELVALADRRCDKPLECPDGGRFGGFGGFGVGEDPLERSVGEVAEQFLAGREMAVERADANSRLGGDRGHRDARPLPVDCRRGGPDESLAVAGRVAARFARAADGDHAQSTLPRPWRAPVLK
jgi:hypothetical protein